MIDRIINAAMGGRLRAGFTCLMLLNLTTLAIFAVFHLIAYTVAVTPLTLIGWAALAVVFYRKVMI